MFENVASVIKNTKKTTVAKVLIATLVIAFTVLMYIMEVYFLNFFFSASISASSEASTDSTAWVGKNAADVVSASLVTLSWRHLKIAAIVVTVVSIFLLITLGIVVLVRYSQGRLVLPASLTHSAPTSFSSEFYKHQVVSRPLSELMEFYDHYIKNASVPLVDMASVPPARRSTLVVHFLDATPPHTVYYDAEESYLQLVKRISNIYGTPVVLFPYSVRNGVIFFQNRAIDENTVLAVPVSNVSMAPSQVVIERLCADSL